MRRKRLGPVMKLAIFAVGEGTGESSKVCIPEIAKNKRVDHFIPMVSTRSTCQVRLDSHRPEISMCFTLYLILARMKFYKEQRYS